MQVHPHSPCWKEACISSAVNYVICNCNFICVLVANNVNSSCVNVIKAVAINGNLYFASGDISPNLIYGLFSIITNMDLWEKYYGTEYGSNYLYELVDEKEWTLDALLEFSKGLKQKTRSTWWSISCLGIRKRSTTA